MRAEPDHPWQWLAYSQEHGRPRPDSLYIPGESTAPAGRYNVSLVTSARFYGRIVPFLRCVRAADGSRPQFATYFHPGHHVASPEGCIQIGLEHDGPRIRKTKPAFETLLALLDAAKKDGLAVDLEIE